MKRPGTFGAALAFAASLCLNLTAQAADDPTVAIGTEEKAMDDALDAAVKEKKAKLAMIGSRIYGMQDGSRLSAEFRCTKYDYRTFHLCLQPRFFNPSGRIYFDTGADGTNEVDIFRNGSLSPTIDFISLYVPWRLGKPTYYDRWSWGPMIGIGLTSAAKDAEDGSQQASTAPVAMMTAGFMLEYRYGSGPAFGVEIGVATGYSSDEAFGSSESRNDSAVYVGLRISVPTESTKE